MKHSIAAWLIKKMQRYGPRRVHVLGKDYEISPDVFNPKFYYTSEFMARNINPQKGDEVLDIGTGSGIQAITAAEKASKVVAVDINPEAVRFTRKNVSANGLDDKVIVIEGNLFSPIKKDQAFDIILFTPPYLVGDIQTGLDHALFDSDKSLLKRFYSEAGDYLKKDGYIQMLYSSIADNEEALRLAAEFGWSCETIAFEKTFTEKFYIYKFKKIQE